MDRRFGAVFLIGAPEGFAVDGNDIRAQFRQRRDPGDKAILECFGVQGRKQIAERIIGRRAVREGSEPAQEIELLPAKLGNLDPTVSTARRHCNSVYSRGYATFPFWRGP